MTDRTADALVIFGITGDLAHKMTFRALYRLEARGLLRVPVIGVAVDDWDAERLRKYARESIEGSVEKLDENTVGELAKRLSYVSGDFGDSATYEKVATAIGDASASNPTFYLEIPPSLFARVIKGLADAHLLDAGQRVVVEKPFGHDLASARALAAELHKYLDESQLFRIDHFLGKMGLEEILYLRFANTVLEPAWSRHQVACVQVTLAESFGVEDRGHFYDPVGALRDVVVNHLLQLLAAAAMEPPSGSDPDTLNDAKRDVFRAIEPADPGRYVRGQYDGYRQIDGVAPDSSTETYAALALNLDNWRWSGVPFFIRAGKCLAVTATELRVVFRPPPRLYFITGRHRQAAPAQLVFRIGPDTGIRMVLDAHRADHGGPQEIELDMEFTHEGGEGPTAYEVLLHAAMEGDRTHFTRQDIVEETWRIVQPLLDAPGQVNPYRPGSRGPEAADRLVTHYGGWRGPWTGT
jgi:glucose-6-phosphate 1-dehydrogenase